jgi:hypothetical protein
MTAADLRRKSEKERDEDFSGKRKLLIKHKISNALNTNHRLKKSKPLGLVKKREY